MSKYIEAEWLIARIPSEEMIAKMAVAQAPTIDVVHCRECRMADWYTAIDGSRYCYCMITGASPMTDNDFCSFGEREDE